MRNLSLSQSPLAQSNATGFLALIILALFLSGKATRAVDLPDRPHIILVMADDQGWAQTGYYDHPVLKTPNLDKMASRGIRFDRFYAGAPVCSPTRASVLTGRSNDRTGVESHGYALRKQETTLATILGSAGYATGHFGKWHLNGIRGPGVPILKEDSHGPGNFGFDHWTSVTNFFDMNPILSRNGTFEPMTGDSSEITVKEAIQFIDDNYRTQPTLSVIWFGSPHDPAKASEQDRQAFSHLDEKSQHHYGELVAMDRSIGTLFSELSKRNLDQETLVWFCSDNGGLPRINPSSVGPLRGNKGTIFEGGIRVPGIIHWPTAVEGSSRVTSYPASVLDIVPTILEITGLTHPNPLLQLDGMSLLPVLQNKITHRQEPIPFRHLQRSAWIDNDYKLLHQNMGKGDFELYNLKEDPAEKHNLASSQPQKLAQMIEAFEEWNRGVELSVQGRDYPEGKLLPGDPEPRFWTDMDVYRPYFDEWKNRWEYASRLTPKPARKNSPTKTPNVKNP